MFLDHLIGLNNYWAIVEAESLCMNWLEISLQSCLSRTKAYQLLFQEVAIVQTQNFCTFTSIQL